MMASKANEILTFARCALSNPRQIGAILPCSPRLGQLMSRYAHLTHDSAIVEIGAGTGVITQSLLEAGVPRDQLYVVELDMRLAQFLEKRFPGTSVINGNATDIAQLLPAHLVGKISTVISSLPVRLFAFDLQQAIVQAAFTVLAPEGAFVQYTYPAGPPLPAARLKLRQEKLGRIWINMPPAAVWRYTRA